MLGTGDRGVGLPGCGHHLHPLLAHQRGPGCNGDIPWVTWGTGTGVCASGCLQGSEEPRDASCSKHRNSTLLKETDGTCVFFFVVFFLFFSLFFFLGVLKISWETSLHLYGAELRR